MDEKENVDEVTATSAQAGSIQQISGGVVHQICSGQVVLSLATAVKELVENSLDAGASMIEVKVRGQGAETVEVSDNGHGVEESNFSGLTVKHATSKLREFTDLTSVQTFGFRGEALSSLCALSNLSISTRHESAVLGTLLTYDHSGVILTRSNTARPVGTTVTIRDIFSTMPVRQKEFQRNIKKEYNKMISVITAYSLVSSGVKIKVTSTKKNGKTDTVMQTQGSVSLRENIVHVFGVKMMSSLRPVEQVTLTDDQLLEANIKGPVPEVQLQGFISSPVHGEGRGAPDRQFLFINKRPCDHSKLSKIINQVYHSYNRHQFPFLCLNVQTEKETVDVNITPDKRQIFLTQEKYLIELVKRTLEKMFEDAPSTMPLQTFVPTNISTNIIKSEESSSKSSVNLSNLKRNFSRSFSSTGGVKEEKPAKKSRTMFDFVKVSCSGDGDNITNCDDQTDETETDYKAESLDEDDSFVTNHSKSDVSIKSSSGLKLIFDDFSQTQTTTSEENDEEDPPPTMSVGKSVSLIFDDCPVSSSQDNQNGSNSQEQRVVSSGLSLIFDDFTHRKNEIEESWKDDNVVPEETFCEEESVETKGQVGDEEKKIVSEDEQSFVVEESKTNSRAKRYVDVSFNFAALKQSTTSNDTSSTLTSKSHFKAQILPSDNDSAEKELKKQLEKQNFYQMNICGQFNLGFIITALDKDLFIIDQHATDEKYNFETLQRTTVIKSQKMVRPQTLELTSVNESILLENLTVFEKNGFLFDVDEEAASTLRVKLVSLPMSKNWTFGKEDIDEMIFMLSEMSAEENTSSLRPSRVLKMLASRACRSSVMIGRSLSMSEMVRLVQHMAEIEQPWNCPHGRPTIRHLINTDYMRL